MAYHYADVPPSGNQTSRFELSETATGISMAPGEVAGVAYGNLVAEAINAAPTIPPEQAVVKLLKVAITPAGEYVTAIRAEARGLVTAQPVRPGKFATLGDLAEGSLLDDFCLRGEAYQQARDDVVWEAARAWSERVRLQGHNLSVFNDNIALLILLRVGVVVRNSWDIPG